MSDAQATFNTKITATDQTGPAIKKLNADVTKAAAHLGSLGTGATHMFKEMKHGALEFGHALHHVREGIGKLYEGIRSLASPTEALAGLGAIGGIFELTASVAENFGHLEHAAKIIGVTTEELQKLHFVAKMTDTDTGKLDKAMERLAVHIGGAMMGKDKDAAGLFKALHINLKDAHGLARGTAAIFQDMFEVFEKNPDTNMRDKIAMALFGMRGIDVAAMLGLQRDKLREFFGTFDDIKYSLTDTEKLNLGRFHESWETMKEAVAQLGIAIGSKLSGVLTPVVDDFTKWVAKNKEWLSQDIASKIGSLVDYLRHVDWKGLWTEIGDGTGKLLTALGLVADAIIGIGDAYKSLMSLIHPGKAADLLEVTPREIELFLTRQANLKTMPMLLEPDLRPFVNPALPGFGMPMPDFTLGLPGFSAIPPPRLPAPMHSLDGWGMPPAPVRGQIDINITGAPPGTTVQVSHQDGVTLRPRIHGELGEGMDRAW